LKRLGPFGFSEKCQSMPAPYHLELFCVQALIWEAQVALLMIPFTATWSDGVGQLSLR
jgi:hypothetical protein